MIVIEKIVVNVRQRINKDIPDTELCNFLTTSRLLADELSKQELRKYFSRIIKPGNYFSLKEAIKLINKQENIHAATKTKLIDMLKLIDGHHTISNAREYFISSGNGILEKANLRADFNHTLRVLADLKINPVVIPTRWRTPYIPGIMTVYAF